MTIAEQLARGAEILGESQAQQLFQWLLDKTWSELLLSKEESFPPEKTKSLDEALAELQKGKPLAHLRGYQDFYKFRFKVNADVLIPRPETEIMVETALDMMGESATLMDLGTGSGCIGLSVAKEKPQCKAYLFDSSEPALKVAQSNAQSFGLSNIHFVKGQVGLDDLPVGALKGQVDFILANPPYIAEGDDRVSESVHTYEPHEALYSRNNGLEWIHLWLRWSYDYLKNGGHLMMEFGADQENSVKQISQETGYQFIKFINDYSGKIRFILLSK